jgi:WD40 repeat protein
MSTLHAPFGEALEAWFSQLDRAGFHIGMRERIVVHALFAQLAAANELPKVAALERMLELARPLLCSQPEQQRNYILLQREFLKQQATARGEPASQQGALQADKKASIPASLWASLALILLVIAVSILWLSPAPPDRITPEPEVKTVPNAQDPQSPATRVYVPVVGLTIQNAGLGEMPAWSTPARAALLALGSASILSLCWLAWANWRRQLYLQGTRTDQEVEERLLADPNPVNLEPPPSITRRAARGLRQRFAGERVVLDVPATLRATMQAHGGLTPRYSVVKQTPEYLVLIDRRHPADHHAAYSETFVAALARSGVAIQVYSFEGSPQSGCWRPRSGTDRSSVVSFAELASRHGGQRMIVFAEARALINEVDGTPQPWTRHLGSFPQRAWFTPMPLASWGHTEQAADELGFLALPMQVEALDTLADWFASGHLGLNVAADWPIAYPRLLQDAAITWVTRPSAPAPHIVETLLFELRSYLGPMRFQWLCACAIFPAISTQITAALGRELARDTRELALGVAAIGALPWFRHGFMPAWLRLTLLQQLSPDNESRFREVIEERLGKAIEGPGAALVNVAQRKRRLAAWLRRARGPARDVVLVDFVRRGPLSRLAQKLPDAVRRRVFNNGVAAYGLGRGPLVGLSLGALLTVIASPGVWGTIVEPLPSPPSSALMLPLQAHSGGAVKVSFSPDGRKLLSAGADGKVQELDVTNPAQLVTKVSIPITRSGLEVLALSPADGWVATTDLSDNLRLWSLANGPGVGATARGVTAALFGAVGEQVLITGNRDGKVFEWKWGAAALSTVRMAARRGAVTALARNGRSVASGGDDGILQVMGEGVDASLSGHEGRITSIAFSPTGETLLSVDASHTLRVWDIASASVERTISGTGLRLTQARYTNGSSYIMAGGLDGMVQIFDATTGQGVGSPMPAAASSITDLTISPDGARFAIASEDGKLAMLGAPLPSQLDIVDCADGGSVSTRTRKLADELVGAARAGQLPSLSTVAYVSVAWPQPIPLPPYRVIYRGSSGDQAIAERIAQWLTLREGLTPANGWRVDAHKALGDSRYVIYACPASNVTAPPAAEESPAEEISKLPLEGTYLAVFACEVAGDQARKIVDLIQPAFTRLGGKPNIQYIDERQRATFAPSDRGLNIRVTPGEATEESAADELLRSPEFKNAGRWQRVRTNQRSTRFLSVFICPVDYSSTNPTQQQPQSKEPAQEQYEQGQSPVQQSTPRVRRN